MSTQENMISIWYGTFDQEQQFLDYLDIDYENDIDSQFMQDFAIDYYDEDLSESNFNVEHQPFFLQQIRQHSYGNTFSKQLEQDISLLIEPSKFNAVFLIYDFDARNLKSNSITKLNFLGCYSFNKHTYFGE
ncbi:MULTISPECIES: immunity 22 family protein [unclassified Acinetobacter]|uniref:immunity 22 family protein n=1 Tax=unclassified Acinetobacter TaxID=196816 RepID=UPI0035B75113